MSKQTQNNLIKNGKHNFQKRSDGTSLTSDRVKAGTHNFLDGKAQRQKVLNQLKNGTHPSQVEWTCTYCNKSGKGSGNFTKSHGNNCKLNLNIVKNKK